MRTSEGMKPNRAAAAAAMSPDVIDEGVQIAEKTAQKLDFSGMFLVAVPSSSVDFGFITNLDLSNNNLEVYLFFSSKFSSFLIFCFAARRLLECFLHELQVKSLGYTFPFLL